MRKLAAITCGLFVEVEASGFERHLHTVLPILEHQIQPDKYQQVLYFVMILIQDFYSVYVTVNMCIPCIP